MAGSEIIAAFRTMIEWAALGIEAVAVVVIVAGVIKVVVTRGTMRYLFHAAPPGESERYKHQLGKTLLLGLEFLVAADVVRTVALEPTLRSVGILGVLVAIRTFRSWSLAVEIEGRWPWQPRAPEAASEAASQMPAPNEPERTAIG